MTQEQLTDIKNTLEKIVENMFLCEPLMFATYCTHVLTINPKIIVPFRSGNMRIEYNPAILEKLEYGKIKERFETEIIRIILKHPYSRRPNPFDPLRGYLASEITIHQNKAVNLAALSLPPRLSYEQYYNLLGGIGQNEILSHFSGSTYSYSSANDQLSELSAGVSTAGDSASSDSGSGDSASGAGKSSQENSSMANSDEYGATGLWDENELATEEINSLIKNYAARGGNAWGSISQHLKEQIIASLTAKIDYRKVLKNFRASILAESTHLTRFKPSRRFGFEYMGSKRDFTTKLLLAIDTSGSISDEDLKNFYGVVNKFFKYGIESIDVLNFDCEIQGKPVKFKKRQNSFTITGRGGTSFQPVFDYAKAHPEYDGVIIFTDGYADHPEKKPGTRAKFVWVLNSEENYYEHLEWTKETGKSCFLTL